MPGAADPYPATLTVGLEKVETLRYGENPHQPAARYRRPGGAPHLADGPFASAAALLQGKALSYNNVLDASAAAALGRALRGPACVIVKHTNPCGAAERRRPRGVGGGARRRSGVGLRRRRRAHPRGRPTSPRRSSRSSSRSSSRPASTPKPGRSSRPSRTFGSSSTRHRSPHDGHARGRSDRLDPDGRRRGPRDRSGYDPRRSDDLAGRHAPRADRRGAARSRPRLAPGPWRHLERDRARPGRPLVGLGSGQTSRVDAARQAVEKAGRDRGRRVLRGRRAPRTPSTRSPTRVEVCLEAGVTAFVQPGGSMRDDDVIAATERAGATMLLTGVRHFRH